MPRPFLSISLPKLEVARNITCKVSQRSSNLTKKHQATDKFLELGVQVFTFGVRNNFPQVCFPRVGNWQAARFFMFVRQFNDFCELLSRIFMNARQYNDFLVFLDTFPTVVKNGTVGSVFSPSSRNCFYNGLWFAQLNRRRGVEIWRALAMLWTLATIVLPRFSENCFYVKTWQCL